MKTAYDIQKIMEILPHRYPFLLIDRVIEIVAKEKIVTMKNVTINEPFFQGHFPGAPIMPGVMIIEAMAQTGGILAIESLPELEKGSLMYFMAMDRVKFRNPVVPGDQIIFDVKFLKKRGKALKMSGIARVDGKIAAQAELLAMIGEKL
ncbi:3-hydroxyacyl-ACP dehydratase FabZ [Thermodesulfobacteriota bacterium]